MTCCFELGGFLEADLDVDDRASYVPEVCEGSLCLI